MISADVFAVDPWSIPERELHLDLLGQTETIFALSNGHIGLRGNLEEGEPSYTPGTFLNSFYEIRPLPYAESAYGNPEAGQTIINVTDGKVIRLLVDDEPFDVRYGKLVRHERVLDLRTGVLRREAEWVSPAGRGVRVRSQRLGSFVQRSGAAILYGGEPLGAATRIRVQSRLAAQEPGPARAGGPAGGGGAGRCARSRASQAQRAACQPGAPGAGERVADGGRDGPSGRWARRDRHGGGERARPGPADGKHRAGTGAAAADRQIPRLRVVEPAVAAVAARPGRPGPRCGEADGLGRPAAGAAPLPRRRMAAGGR